MSLVHMATRELREHLSARIDAAHFRGEPTVITRSGEPRAVLMPYESVPENGAADREARPSRAPVHSIAKSGLEQALLGWLREMDDQHVSTGLLARAFEAGWAACRAELQNDPEAAR